jgi:hypothetical protein
VSRLRAQATIKLRDEKITRLSGELVQEGVSYEELRQADEEKDAVILELQQTAATARASLESERKQSRVSCLPAFRLLAEFIWDQLPI